MDKPHERNILAVYDLKDKAGRESFAGLLEMLERHGDWHLFVRHPGEDFTERDVQCLNGRSYDGFVITMPGTRKAMHALAQSKVPTVLVNITDRKLSARTDAVAFIWSDGADIGRHGAEHLLSCGTYRSVGYVHELQYEFYSYEREVAFRQTMIKAGYESLAFPPDKDFSSYQRRLCAWLRDLPKPAAIMAVSDMRAADVISACRAEGISVPGQVAVIGVDNDTAQHARCGMGISSILHNCRLMGQTAVRELEFLFDHPGRRGRPHEILIPVLDVAARSSTASSLSAAKLVRDALTFIEANRLRKLTRKDVVAHLGCSLPLAELRFRQIAGRTIRASIEIARLNEVNRRMRENSFSVRETATALGFSSANHLTRLYKRHFGRTITEVLGSQRETNGMLPSATPDARPITFTTKCKKS